MNLDDELKNIVDKIMEEKREEKDRLLIDALVDIYKQKYSNYQEYYDETRKINNEIYEKYKDRLIFCQDYLPMVDEKIFNYIKSKGNDDYMARETIRILRKKSTYSVDLRLATEEEVKIVNDTLLGDENGTD